MPPPSEFQLIETYFKSKALHRSEIELGIGDDAAVLSVPEGKSLVVSTDTLVSNVHFLPEWDPADIAYKSVMVNLSDIAAMAADPMAISLALTLPEYDAAWLEAFSAGLHQALQEYQIALIGGDTTRGPLSITVTIHGVVSRGKAVKRSTARAGDLIVVSGSLGLAAYVVAQFETQPDTKVSALALYPTMKKCLHRPTPRLDWVPLLRQFATACIDISDGLLADLSHICEQSQLGASLDVEKIPVHSMIACHSERASSKDQRYPERSEGSSCTKSSLTYVRDVGFGEGLGYALHGGDDYELCFTIPSEKEEAFLRAMQSHQLNGYVVGVMEQETGLRGWDHGKKIPLTAQGYQHF